jgi:predicted metal-dependent hydrolase
MGKFVKTFEGYKKGKPTTPPSGTKNQSDFVKFAYAHKFKNDKKTYNDFRFFTSPDGNLTYDNGRKDENKPDDSEKTIKSRLKEIVDSYNAEFDNKVKIEGNKIIVK